MNKTLCFWRKYFFIPRLLRKGSVLLELWILNASEFIAFSALDLDDGVGFICLLSGVHEGVILCWPFPTGMPVFLNGNECFSGQLNTGSFKISSPDLRWKHFNRRVFRTLLSGELAHSADLAPPLTMATTSPYPWNLCIVMRQHCWETRRMFM